MPSFCNKLCCFEVVTRSRLDEGHLKLRRRWRAVERRNFEFKVLSATSDTTVSKRAIPGARSIPLYGRVATQDQRVTCASLRYCDDGRHLRAAGPSPDVRRLGESRAATDAGSTTSSSSVSGAASSTRTSTCASTSTSCTSRKESRAGCLSTTTVDATSRSTMKRRGASGRNSRSSLHDVHGGRPPQGEGLPPLAHLGFLNEPALMPEPTTKPCLDGRSD